MENKVILLESIITRHIYKNNQSGCTVHYIYGGCGMDPCSLQVVTHNPDTNRSFLMHEVTASSKLECLSKMLQYVTDNFRDEHVWSVRWQDMGGQEHLSYFSAVDEQHARNKFMSVPGDGVILSVQKMPIS